MFFGMLCSSNLTWRDMQYLMVYSSNPKYLDDDQWQVNGAGLRVSHWYGFGIIDGATLVNRARNWVTVPQRRNCSYNVTAQFKGSEVATLDSPLTVNVQVNNCNLAYLEHVQAVVSLRLNSGMRKDVSIFLTSSAGTKSVLLPYRPRDRHKDGFHLWPFMTVHSWGEQPQGNWIFSVHVQRGSEVQLQSLQMVLHGTGSIPHSVFVVPTRCHSQCVQGCAREGPQYCDICKHFRLADSLECVEECPLRTFSDKRICRSCPIRCTQCVNAHSCTQCHSHAFRLLNGSCSEQCSDGTFAASNNSCILCHQSCMLCSGPLDSNCTSCHPQFTLRNGACVIREPTSCPVGQYFDHRAHECRPCLKSCASCDGKESTDCVSCFNGLQINLEGQCIDSRQLRSCYPGQYFNGGNSECAACPSFCGNCSDDLTCTSCSPSLYLTKHGTCVASCPLGTISDSEHFICLDMHCHHSCLTCFGPEPVHCNSCPGSLLLLNNACMQSCPPRFFPSNLTCNACHGDCQTCLGPSKNQCVDCPPNRFLNDRVCVTNCPAGSYSQGDRCLKCMTDCFSCISQDSCIQCKSGYYLLDRPLPKCVMHCPSGYVVHPSSLSCRPCPLYCATCSTPLTCHVCQPGYVYYAPSGSCQITCPEGYYSSPTGDCITCQTPCSTCIGSALNCSSCSTGMALNTVSRVCTACCNADKAIVECCDCDQDNQFCRWSNATTIYGHTSDTRLPTHILIGIGATCLLVVLCALLLVVLVRQYYCVRFNRKYQKVPEQDNLDNANGSDTDLLTDIPL